MTERLFEYDSKNYRYRRHQMLWDQGIRNCYYCNNTLSKSVPDGHPNKSTLEHLISRIDIRRGLVNSDDYTVLCCSPCNKGRGVREYDELGYRFYKKELHENMLVTLLKNYGGCEYTK